MNFIVSLLLILSLCGADALKINLNQSYAVYDVESAWQSPPGSQVTYVIDGVEYRPDHKMYDASTGQSLGNSWWGIIDPELIRNHLAFEKMARDNNSPIKVYVSSSSATYVDALYTNSSTKVAIDAPGFATRYPRGILVSPNGDNPIFTLHGLEYHPDGKVYKDGKPTNEHWGIPIEALGPAALPSHGGFNQAVSDFLGPNGLGLQGLSIVTVQNFISDQKQWNDLMEQRTAEVQAQMKAAIDFDVVQAQQAAAYADHIAQQGAAASEHFTSWLAGTHHFFEAAPSSFLPAATPLQNINDQLVEFEYDETTQNNLNTQALQAVRTKSFERASELIDVTLNSQQGLAPSLKDVTREGRIFLPEKLNPQLPPGPFSQQPLTWKQNTHIGQVATRTVNRLQAQWGQTQGLQNMSPGKVANYLSSLAMVQKALEMLPTRPMDSLALFKTANFILDSGVGLTHGLGEGLVNTVKSIPELAQLAYNGFTESLQMIQDPALALRRIGQLIDALPEIKQALYQRLNAQLNNLTGADDYERARLVGATAFDVVMNYALGGTKAVAGTVTSSKTLMAAKDHVLGIKKSAAWLEAMKPHLSKIDHLFDSAKNFQFYSPGTSSNPFFGLDEWVAHTFSGATFMSYELTKPIVLFRVYSDDTARKGRFLTDIPRQGTGAMMDLSLMKATGNQATKWALIEIPAGTKIFEGTAASYQLFDHKGVKYISPEVFSGGGTQYFINHVDLEKVKVLKYGDFQK